MPNIVLELFSAVGHEYSCYDTFLNFERLLVAVVTVQIFDQGVRGVLKGFLRSD
jgi:hypothetical protein